MCRSFEGYKSVSYTGIRGKGVDKLKKKMKNNEKIVKITTTSSHVYQYRKKIQSIFIAKLFIYFFSGFFSTFVSNYVEFYLNKLKLKKGIEIKIEEN